VQIPSEHKLPPFLYENRNEIQQIRDYAKEKILTLSIEMLSEYITNGKVAVSTEGERYEEEVKDLMHQNRLKICPSTIYG
jgi:hypothetical protein